MGPACPTGQTAAIPVTMVGMPAVNPYRKLSFWHDTVPGTLEPGPAARGPRRGRGDRRRGIHRPVDRLLPVPRRPGAEDSGLRARYRRVRRLGTQRRLVLGPVPCVPGQAGADGGPGRG